MSIKSENTPDQTSIKPGEIIDVDTRFGSLSRGKCWGKYFPHKKRPVGDFEWCSKSGGTVYCEGPGYYIIGSNDGFNRKAQGEFYLAPAE